MKSLLAAVFLILCASTAFAGAAIKAFQPGTPPPKEVLESVPVKSVVAELLDPDNTHLGKEVGYVLWREILDAVSDQHGAGVILAHAGTDKRLVDMLQTNYHQAALQIAVAQKARMAIWGALTESQGIVSIDTYLSLVGDATQNELALKLTAGKYGQTKETGYEARLSRTRFNFPRIRISRGELFDRPLLVAAETSLQKSPHAGNPLKAVHINENLHTDGIEGEWFRVRLPDGTHAYINSLHILLPPRTVDAGGVSLGTKACSSSSAANPLPSGSIGTVLTAQRFAKSGLCYLIKTSEGEGWVAASQVRRIYSLPIVQFTAGLYRYQLGRYELAATEFRNYVQLESAPQDPPSLSSAYQLLAASELMGAIPHSMTAALSALHSAISVTPYDASAYSMRALASLSNQDTFVGASLRDLSEALELDPDQPDARNTVALLMGIKPGKFNPLAQEGIRFTMTEQDSSTLKSLASKYAIDAR